MHTLASNVPRSHSSRSSSEDADAACCKSCGTMGAWYWDVRLLYACERGVLLSLCGAHQVRTPPYRMAD
jgi:hypothetical protein